MMVDTRRTPAFGDWMIVKGKKARNGFFIVIMILLPTPLCRITPEQGGKEIRSRPSDEHKSPPFILVTLRSSRWLFPSSSLLPPIFYFTIIILSPLTAWCLLCVFRVSCQIFQGRCNGKKGICFGSGKVIIYLFIYFPWPFLFLSFFTPLCFLYSLFSLISTGLYEFTFIHRLPLSSLLPSICDPFINSCPCWYSKEMGGVWTW